MSNPHSHSIEDIPHAEEAIVAKKNEFFVSIRDLAEALKNKDKPAVEVLAFVCDKKLVDLKDVFELSISSVRRNSVGPELALEELADSAVEFAKSIATYYMMIDLLAKKHPSHTINKLCSRKNFDQLQRLLILFGRVEHKEQALNALSSVQIRRVILENSELERRRWLGMSRIQDYRYFYVACVTGVVAIILTIWGFYLGNLTEDQRAILSGFDAVLFGLSSGGFMGSLTVKSKGIVPAVVTAGGGFAVWFLVFYFMFK